MKQLNDILTAVKDYQPISMVVVFPHDDDVLKAVCKAAKLNIIKPILIGDKNLILQCASEYNHEIEGFEIIEQSDPIEASLAAVKIISEGNAQLLMKGLLDTSIILKAVLNRDYGLRTGNVLSHVAVLEIPTIDRLLYLSDGAMNMYPTLDEKKQIIENSVKVARALDNTCPKVGVLAAIEKLNPKMQATVDAIELVNLNKQGLITNCIVGGPYALDNAVSKEAARHKGLTDELAGMIDILIVPYIEAGNVLYKSAVYFGNAKAAGIIMGAKVPIVLTSRSDNDQAKLYSIALGSLISYKNRG